MQGGSMMDILDAGYILLRWIHVFAGIIWIGFLFFFGFIMGPAIAEMGPENSKPVYPSFMGRTTRWIRVTVYATYISGLILLGAIFHGGGMMFEQGSGWGPVSGTMALLPFLLFLPYDMLSKSSLGKNMMFMGIAFIGGSMLFMYAMTDIAGMTYRAAMIHMGLFYGTVMAANVFMRVLPAQRRILAAMKENTAPDPLDVASTQLRAKHNMYFSLPLIWTMMNQHTVTLGGSSPLWFLGVLVVSTGFIAYLYKGSAPKP
jgi:uncharacterized membrane protein